MRRVYGNFAAWSAAVLAIALMGLIDAHAQKLIRNGDVLSGQLNMLRTRAPKGKRVSSFQLVSEPRRLPGSGGLCNLETGPETFQLVTSNNREVSQLRRLAGKEISVKVSEVDCAHEAGQMSEAVVTKWSVVANPS